MRVGAKDPLGRVEVFVVADARRWRAEKALHAVVVDAYVKGVSTRKVDDLVRALGIDGISRSKVSGSARASI